VLSPSTPLASGSSHETPMTPDTHESPMTPEKASRHSKMPRLHHEGDGTNSLSTRCGDKKATAPAGIKAGVRVKIRGFGGRMRTYAKTYKVIAEVPDGWRLQCDESGAYVARPGASLALCRASRSRNPTPNAVKVNTDQSKLPRTSARKRTRGAALGKIKKTLTKVALGKRNEILALNILTRQGFLVDATKGSPTWRHGKVVNCRNVDLFGGCIDLIAIHKDAPTKLVQVTTEHHMCDRKKKIVNSPGRILQKSGRFTTVEVWGRRSDSSSFVVDVWDNCYSRWERRRDDVTK
jgi:hypothetical protein